MKRTRFSLRISLIPAIFLLLAAGCGKDRQTALPTDGDSSLAYVDPNGILRWQGTDEEICRYGVNYTVPFAHAYRAAGYLGVDREEAIRQDVYHFARLGLDAFRVHVWDCEISDTLGNLIENDHLHLLDFLLNEMSARGMKFIITPIAYWGNGYPERDEDTPGFSTKYGKGNSLTDTAAIRAQEVYLDQFVRHVNPYTGFAYKDDPSIIAYEICNEPHHGGSPRETTDFINRLSSAIRSTGCEKPVFYNISHSISLGEAYFASDIDGGTFQWYPAGLVAGHELRGNFLPNVADYKIPYKDTPGYDKMANIVYEYDAADIGRSYIHPYMAKAFREAGMQFVAQFAYDPMYTAYANTEYQTHYMNFAYAPGKALSLKIASEVFHRLPLKQPSGTYPSDTVFDVFRVSYRRDLSEMLSEGKFFYTNNTMDPPPAPENLRHIAGCGSSAIVQYDGTGAYMLDRIGEGVWRLEVMPDAVWVRDPFERASLKKKVSVILWREHEMQISLGDLGEGFSVRGLNQGNGYRTIAEDGSFSISPGTYLLVSEGIGDKSNSSAYSPDAVWNNIRLGEFVAPPQNCEKTYVIHHPALEVNAGSDLDLSATIVAPGEPESVEVQLFAGWRPQKIPLEKTGSFTYRARIAAETVRPGFLRYHIVVKGANGYRTFPADVEGQASDWDFHAEDIYSVRVVEPGSPVLLFNAVEDASGLYGNTWNMSEPSIVPGETVSVLRTRNLEGGEHRIDAGLFTADRLKARNGDPGRCSQIVFQGYSTAEENLPVEISLVLDDGTRYGGQIVVGSKPGTARIRIDRLKKLPAINMPRSYPGFQPFYSVGNFDRPFDMKRVEALHISVGPGIPPAGYNKSYGLAISKVWLE